MRLCSGHVIACTPFCAKKPISCIPCARHPLLEAKRDSYRHICRAEEKDEVQTESETSQNEALPREGQSQLNKWFAGGAIALGIALVAFTRVSPGQVTLTELQRRSVPLETALQNGRPTLMEFYATWCEVCNDMAADTADLKSRYGDKLNFVMLNIENSRWLPEMAEYRVSGVPHFVFLDANGAPQAATIGRLPKEVLDINTKALVEGQSLPFKRKVGATSSAENMARQGSMAGPRSHA